MSKYYVSMTDKFMSDWGLAKGRTNKLVIECDTFEQAQQIEKAAKSRSEMIYVNVCSRKPYYPRATTLTTRKTYADMGGMWYGD